MNLSCIFGHSWVENGQYKYMVKQNSLSFMCMELYEIQKTCSCCNNYKLSGSIKQNSNLMDVLLDKNKDLPHTLFHSSIDSANLSFGYRLLKIYNKGLELGDLKRV